ncbi:MAG: hypothetical protein KC912_24545, partial [Proteobacteria bacterium]|nr:hypothetical protein [Pseudomonadota bacterium]
GQTTAQALAPWTQGVGRWMITIGCLASVARGGMLFDLLTNGPKDASGSAQLGWFIVVATIVGFPIGAALVVHHFGVRALDVRRDLPFRR